MLSFYILFLIPSFLIHPHKLFSMQLGPGTASLACARLIVPFAPFNVGYTDPWTLVVKFRRGLWLGIQNQIATMPYGRPANNDPDMWYRAVQRIDQGCLANEAFQSVSRSTPSAPTKTASTRPLPLSVVRLPPVPSLLVTPKPPLPALSMGVPMDVDATQKARPLSLRECYRCGDMNHLVRDCPHRMDVH